MTTDMRSRLAAWLTQHARKQGSRSATARAHDAETVINACAIALSLLNERTPSTSPAWAQQSGVALVGKQLTLSELVTLFDLAAFWRDYENGMTMLELFPTSNPSRTKR